ncbi:MAG: hypothetical protein JSV00_05950 [bacterium]|nr:MAG: hypothetical protein JSV00_05950 [bacterium]
MAPEMDDILGICLRALTWARERDYTGWEKHDGLNSPVLQAIFGWGKWPRILAIQGVMRFPVNLRPFLGIRKHRNPKGIALFARAWLNLHQVTGDTDHLLEARRLLDWLLETPAGGGWPGMAWGYPYPWQDPGFFAPSGMPNRIVTYFVGRSLLHGFEATAEETYLAGARKAVEFILTAPRVLEETQETLCLSYVPAEGMNMAVVDVPALCGSLCAMVGLRTGERVLVKEAGRLMNWVAQRQTGYGAWYYTDPPGDSHITHDNYHTGEIVDSFLEYGRYSGDGSHTSAYSRGLAFYSNNLFTAQARPKWMHDREFHYDAHGYAQGIITHTLAGDRKTALRVARAALEDLWDETSGRFFYQRRRGFTKRTTFMRWCQAWLTFALSGLLPALSPSS